MREKCFKMGLVLLGKEERSKMRQKCVRISAQEMRSSQTLAAILPWAGLGEFAWILRIHLSFLARFAGASLRQAFGLPQREGACLALTAPLSHTGFVCGGRLRQAFVCALGQRPAMGEWTQVNRQRNTPPRWMVDQELQELREEMAWMRSRLSAPSQGSKDKGKGKGQARPKPKGASQGASPPTTATQASSEGPARRRPNLKPNEERATPTLIEIKCQKCQAYNWTSRELCRSCETPLARLPGISSSSTQLLPPVARSPGTTPGKSYADAAAGSPPASQSVLALDKEGLSKRQAELETVIGTLPDESPLKTELSTQLDSVKEKLKDPRQPGARLDSATAGVKKATARREKAEETLKQAQEALEQARLQETRAIQELEDAKAAAAPPPPPDTPPPGSVSLSSDDVAGLISFFQELAEDREAAPGAEPPSKKGRVGPYGETPSLKATKDAAVRAKLERGQAYLGFMLNQSLKSGDGSCQADTQETVSQKGSGKGSGAAPGVSAHPPPKTQCLPLRPQRRRKRKPPNPPRWTKTLQCRMLRPR